MAPMCSLLHITIIPCPCLCRHCCPDLSCSQYVAKRAEASIKICTNVLTFSTAYIQASYSLIKLNACKSIQVQNHVKLDPSLFPFVCWRPCHWVHIPMLPQDYWHDIAGTNLERTFWTDLRILIWHSQTIVHDLCPIVFATIHWVCRTYITRRMPP